MTDHNGDQDFSENYDNIVDSFMAAVDVEEAARIATELHKWICRTFGDPNLMSEEQLIQVQSSIAIAFSKVMPRLFGKYSLLDMAKIQHNDHRDGRLP